MLNVILDTQNLWHLLLVLLITVPKYLDIWMK